MVGARLLSGIPLLAGISARELETLSGALRERRYGKDEVVFYQGDEGASLFVIESGLVKIAVTSADGKEKTLALLGPGEFFGELSLLDGEPRSADAVAAEASHLYILGWEQFLSFLKSYPDASLKILTALSRRLRRTDELVQDVSFLDVPGRLLKTILELAKSRGEPAGSGIVITARLTQTDLATIVGATRESVNKWLGYFQDEGMLRFERGRITVLDINKLRREAQVRAGEVA
ncbi:MAG: Crp/Fnr family transcriptional regulator [Chloroflexi bacterium]|nr:Crp/Fnr family transcriptional regulator [Chloroflexota bacterium]